MVLVAVVNVVVVVVVAVVVVVPAGFFVVVVSLIITRHAYKTYLTQVYISLQHLTPHGHS